MDNAQWPQELVMRPMEEIVPIIGNNKRGERKGIRFQKEQVLNCPRCNSGNTKFCYYNNYSLSQPRYFCKTCRRYWTAGGSLRNIPVGGGSRKNNKKPSSSSIKKVADLVPPVPISADQNSSKIHGHHQDLNLGGQLSAMELLTGFTSIGLSTAPFMSSPSIVPISDPNLIYSPGMISLPQSKQCLKICLDGADEDRDWNNGVLRGGGGGESW